jgi:hypothetical protein
LAGAPHYWSTQPLPETHEEAFRQAVEQLQDNRGGARVRGENIRQLLSEQVKAVLPEGVRLDQPDICHDRALRGTR